MFFVFNWFLPQLSIDEAKELDKPILLFELKLALTNMTKGKTPGIDGIPPEMFLFFLGQLGPIFMETLQVSIRQGYFHRDLNTALI